HDKIVERALEVRGCKVQITEVPIPVHFGPAFEGERIRKGEFRAEFGGKRNIGFEFLTMREMDEVVDGQIEVIGPDIDVVEEAAALPLGIWVEVAGRKMQPDFEPILERQIHHQINGAAGVWHMGQRDIVWIRISKEAFDKGFRIRHLGEIVRAKLLSDFPAIVDKVQVRLYVDEAPAQPLLEEARQVWHQRNMRLAEMTDENVDTFYSCLLCQSFAPNHVCIIPPERLGLCGAYDWLDGKAAYEIDPTGPNQPVRKGLCLDPVRGQWAGIDEYVHMASNRTLEEFSAYSLMVNPMTSCGCFECIVGIVPECNGVMIVDRDFHGMTPCGMTFTTLAGMIGGGIQTPGFVGIGKSYISSSKFISAEGGISRVVWMPSHLREQLRPLLMERLGQDGLGDLLDKIADETLTADPMELMAHCDQVGHPALTMDPLF
ncbi:MAG: CO dehydrogenase/CO-methylating acetyl-CoA synthase complex subunit beta, partial [Proteobacteria bacterium]|nr:CO dehydrogenase/CO-methylating acetyl-CoA synthase complex subunit beta [Pseudomonadota bacterium]